MRPLPSGREAPLSSIADSILHLHGLAALGLVFLLPAAESAIFLGFVFPGETAALLAGVLAYEGRVSLAAAMAAVVAGAVVGDTVGYAVGRRWGTRLLHGPASRWIKPSHVERAQAAINRHGGKTVFFGRFTTALRVLVPGVAGMAELPYRRFVAFNVAGGLIWGVGFVLLGYAAGSSWRSVASAAGTVGLVALAVVVVALVVGLAVRRRHRDRREAV